MFLVRYGAYVDGSDRDFCFREAIRQLNLVFDRCEKDGSGLLYHAYSARPGTPWANVVTCLLYTSYIRYRARSFGNSNSDIEDYIQTKLIESLFKFRFL